MTFPLFFIFYCKKAEKGNKSDKKEYFNVTDALHCVVSQWIGLSVGLVMFYLLWMGAIN